MEKLTLGGKSKKRKVEDEDQNEEMQDGRGSAKRRKEKRLVTHSSIRKLKWRKISLLPSRRSLGRKSRRMSRKLLGWSSRYIQNSSRALKHTETWSLAEGLWLFLCMVEQH